MADELIQAILRSGCGPQAGLAPDRLPSRWRLSTSRPTPLVTPAGLPENHHRPVPVQPVAGVSEDSPVSVDLLQDYQEIDIFNQVDILDCAEDGPDVNAWLTGVSQSLSAYVLETGTLAPSSPVCLRTVL